MALIHSPSIPTNGLVLLADFANVKSWPGSGTTVYDLSPSKNHGVLSNSPVIANGAMSISSTTLSNCNFNATAPNRDTLNLTTANGWTVFTSTRYNGTGSNARGRILQACYNNWLLGHWGGNDLVEYAEGWVVYQSGSSSDTNWRIYCATGNKLTNTYQFYVNGVLLASNSNGSQGPGALGIGNGNGAGLYNEPSDGDCGILGAYNRELTADEVSQIYNSFKGRYGI